MLRFALVCTIICLFLFVLCGLSTAQNRNLCDICECLPSYVEPSYVNCNCKKNKVLILKDEDGDTFSSTKVLNISTCNFVSFPAKGFPRSRKLKSVQIRQMALFHLTSGMFPALTNLAIEDIGELIIDGFHGQSNLTNIEIKNSYLSEIAEDSLKDLKNLEKLIFHDVSINTIPTNSMVIASGISKPVVKFVNCKIDIFQSESVSMNLSKIEIVNSTVNIISSDAFNVSASDSIDLIRSTFGPNLSPDSFKFRSSKINIVENEFKSLPPDILKGVVANDDKKINFIANLIHDVDLGAFLLNTKLDKLNFVRNKIMCDCTPRKTSILKLKELFPGLITDESHLDSIIENNLCKNYNGIFLNEFKRRILSGSLCNETDTKLLHAYGNEQAGNNSSTANTAENSETKDSSSSVLLYSYRNFVLACIFSNVYFNYIF